MEKPPIPPLTSESSILVSFPAEHVLQVAFNRPPKTMNAMTSELKRDVEAVMDWFERENTLWAVIITSTSPRAFCAGMDLSDWLSKQTSDPPKTPNMDETKNEHGTGVGGLSRRRSKKPIIAAVNGYAVGGGLEIVLNCDIVVAGESAKFAYPEVKRGVTVASGGIPRLVKVSGHQLAAELLLTGRTIGSKEARDRFRFVNEVVPDEQVLSSALSWAQSIIANSPDAVWSNKRGIIAANELGGLEAATLDHTRSAESENVFKDANVIEGLRSFVQKREPVWVSPKL